MTCSAVAFRAVRPVRFAGSVVISFLHVGVVAAQIGAGCGVLAALPDPACGLIDRGAVEPASGIDDRGHGLGGGREPAGRGHVPDVVEQVGARPSVHSVEQVAHVFGEIAPNRAFAPHPGLARDDRQQRRRLHDGARLPPPHAFQRHDMFAVRAAQLDAQGPDPGPDAHGMPSRAGEVPVAIDQDRAGTVRFHAPPVACVERRARQREHMIQIGLEQIPDRRGLAVVLPACDLVALVQPRPRRRVPPLGRGFGHHQVAIARTRPRSPRCPSRGPRTGCRTWSRHP